MVGLRPPGFPTAVVDKNVRRLRDHVGAAQAVAFQDATGPQR